MRTPVREGHTIIVIGAWNPRIFSPGWVGQHLVQGEAEIGVGIMIGSPTMPLRLTFGGVHVTVNINRLLVEPQELDDPSLERMQNCASAVVQLLSHTPMTAVGINFRFDEDEPQQGLLRTFEASDSAGLADFGAEVVQRGVRRQINHDGVTINLSLELRPNGHVVFDFNFHRDVAGSEAALEHLGRGILNLQQIATQLLDDVYYAQPNNE